MTLSRLRLGLAHPATEFAVTGASIGRNGSIFKSAALSTAHLMYLLAINTPLAARNRHPAGKGNGLAAAFAPFGAGGLATSAALVLR